MSFALGSATNTTAPARSSAARILEFGYADHETPSGRSTLLLSALRREGFRVNSLLVDPRSRAKSLQFVLNVLRAGPTDFLFLRFPYFLWMLQCAVVLKKRLGARLIIDAMVSAYETIIDDRALYHPQSRQARSCIRQDLLVGEQGDLLVVDTQLHANYLATQFKCRESKMIVVPVGSPLFELFGEKRIPLSANPALQKLTVLYLGSFVPLHGMEVVIEAVRLVSSHSADINFTFIGEGQDYQRARNLAAGIKSVSFLGALSRERSIIEIENSDIVLGIFGSSQKSDLVIPFKVYDGLAFSKPVITASTLASRELLHHGENSWLVDPEPTDLAKAIEQLASDPNLRRRLAAGARKSYETSFHTSVSIKPLVQRLNELSVRRA
jgi:glycosyltransferase involved in cell wall biosynthesis